MLRHGAPSRPAAVGRALTGSALGDRRRASGWHAAAVPQVPGARRLRFDDVSLVVDEGERRIPVLSHVELDVPLEGVTALVGPSGSGKSTLLRLCNRLEAPTSGRVLLDGQDIAELDPLALRRRLGMVFQRPTLFPGTVRDNCRVADPAADDERCGAALERCGLPASFLDRTADDLSGGEAQRACIARSLLTEPEVLLLDEATSALDPENRHRIEHLARALADGGTPVVWVTHDLDQAARLADRTVVVLDGSVADEEAARGFLDRGREHGGGPHHDWSHPPTDHDGADPSGGSAREAG